MPHVAHLWKILNCTNDMCSFVTMVILCGFCTHVNAELHAISEQLKVRLNIHIKCFLRLFTILSEHDWSQCSSVKLTWNTMTLEWKGKKRKAHYLSHKGCSRFHNSLHSSIVPLQFIRSCGLHHLCHVSLIFALPALSHLCTICLLCKATPQICF